MVLEMHSLGTRTRFVSVSLVCASPTLFKNFMMCFDFSSLVSLSWQCKQGGLDNGVDLHNTAWLVAQPPQCLRGGSMGVTHPGCRPIHPPADTGHSILWRWSSVCKQEGRVLNVAKGGIHCKPELSFSCRDSAIFQLSVLNCRSWHFHISWLECAHCRFCTLSKLWCLSN